MSFMNPVDMVEEDAADLQFPKESDITLDYACDASQTVSEVVVLQPSSTTEYETILYNPHELAKVTKELNEGGQSPSDSNDYCKTCGDELREPFIKCPDCNILMCVQCFAQGRETQSHHNTHSYIIVRDDIQVFPGAGAWTAQEERLLLSTLQSSGYGNWEAVAKALHWARTPDECRQHYHDCYFGGIFERLLGLTHAMQSYFPERMPYVTKMRCVDPPRTDDITSMQFKATAGYRCARGDFDTPYDVSAESLLTLAIGEDINSWADNGSREAIAALQFGLVRAYNNRLKERQRRYRIMRNHGLIMSHRTVSWISKYSDAFGSEANATRFLSFMQICDPIEFDKLVESMKYFTDLRKSIFRLYELRKNGIRTLAGGVRYFKDKKKRLMAQRAQVKNERYQQMYDWRNLVPKSNNMNEASQHLASACMPINIRKKAAPMDIIGLAGYEKLDDAERDLCSVARIYPQNYMDYKNTLKAENLKIGHLRLADARRLIKIDVNKTRQIYDFLLEHGHINKPI